MARQLRSVKKPVTDIQAALTRDIQETMRAWAPQLRECALVFVHAPSANAAPLFHGDAPPLDRGDPRVRSVPFTTRRPTFSETKRVAQTLLTVTASEALAALPPPPSGMSSVRSKGCSMAWFKSHSTKARLCHMHMHANLADRLLLPCRASKAKADITPKGAAGAEN